MENNNSNMIITTAQYIKILYPAEYRNYLSKLLHLSKIFGWIPTRENNIVNTRNMSLMITRESMSPKYTPFSLAGNKSRIQYAPHEQSGSINIFPTYSRRMRGISPPPLVMCLSATPMRDTSTDITKLMSYILDKNTSLDESKMRALVPGEKIIGRGLQSESFYPEILMLSDDEAFSEYNLCASSSPHMKDIDEFLHDPIWERRQDEYQSRMNSIVSRTKDLIEVITKYVENMPDEEDRPEDNIKCTDRTRRNEKKNIETMMKGYTHTYRRVYQFLIDNISSYQGTFSAMRNEMSRLISIKHIDILPDKCIALKDDGECIVCIALWK